MVAVIPEGTYTILNTQTGVTLNDYTTERPSEDRLTEHQEVVVWHDGAWHRPDDLLPTELEQRIMNIRAFLAAIDDEFDELEKLL